MKDRSRPGVVGGGKPLSKEAKMRFVNAGGLRVPVDTPENARLREYAAMLVAGSRGQAAILATRREIARLVAQAVNPRLEVEVRKIVWSSALRLDEAALEGNDRLVVHPDSQPNADFDGDLAMVVYQDDRLAWWKFPLPPGQPVRACRVVPRPEYGFGNLPEDVDTSGMKTVRGLDRDVFLRKHEPDPVGLLVWAWNTVELARPYLEGLGRAASADLAFSDPRRFDEVEGGLKKSRESNLGTAVGMNSVAVTESYAYGVPDWVREVLITANAWRSGKASWVEGWRLTLQRIRDWRLGISRRQNLESTPSRAHRTAAPAVRKLAWADTDPGFCRRCLRIGLMGFYELEPEVELRNLKGEVVKPVVLWLSRNGKPVALVNSRRMGEASFAAVLLPTWAPVYREDGSVVYDWRSGLEMINLRVAASGYAIIRTPDGVPTGNLFPRVLQPEYQGEHLDRNRVKLALLQSVISDCVGEYGVFVPAVFRDGLHVPTGSALWAAGLSVSVDYTFAETVEDRLSIVEAALGAMPEGFGLCVTGVKGQSVTTKKYAVADEEGNPLWTRTLVAQGVPFSAARAGSQLSQLFRLATFRGDDPFDFPMREFRVALVEGESDNPAITPSGALKQRVEGVFMPRLSDEQVEGWEETTYTTWAGETFRAWQGPERWTCRVGKLVDLLGNKFVPRLFGHQVFDESGGKVDILFPISEALAKGAAAAMLSRGKRQTIRYAGPDGVVTREAVVLDWKFGRTGVPGENARAYFKPYQPAGLDGLKICHVLRSAGFDIPEHGEIDEEYADALVDLLRQIDKRFDEGY